jgi:hypothetical protein
MAVECNMVSEDYSYQNTAIQDLVDNYSADHFRFAVGHCRTTIARVIDDDRRSSQQIARVLILKYLDLQLGRAVRWVEEEADLMAMVVRSQIELRFWAQFVSKDEAAAKQFLQETDIDAHELFDRFDKIAPGAIEAPPKVSGKRLSPTRIDHVEEFHWKLCSKLIHPSSFILNNLHDTLFSGEQRQYLAIQVLVYGWGILNILHTIVWTD